MSDFPVDLPALSVKAQEIADRGQFKLSSEPRTGALLRTLAASKPGGRILEVGGAVGVGSGWLLAGMDSGARLTVLEIHVRISAVCRKILEADKRAQVITADATEWLESYDGPPFDLIFVDTTTAKFDRRDLLYRHMAKGALLVADDLLPNDTWTEAHPARVNRLRKEIFDDAEVVPLLLDWASGVLIASYRG